MLKDNTMKFKILILLILFTLDTIAQCCCGKLYFRIYDSMENKMYPAITDTLKMNIDPNAIGLSYWKQIDGKKLPITKLLIKSIQTEGNGGASAINISKSSYTNLLFQFSTGCYTQLKKILVIKGKEKMTLNLVNIPSEATILMDSIPFVEGELTYNIEKIIRKNKLNYEMPPLSKFYLRYLIPYNLIEVDSLPMHKVSFEFKNDTLYNYADSLKTKLVSKGKVKIHKTAIIYYHSTREMMNAGVKRKEKRKSITYLKKGTWTYNFESYSIQRKENEKRKCKLIIDRRRLR